MNFTAKNLLFAETLPAVAVARQQAEKTPSTTLSLEDVTSKYQRSISGVEASMRRSEEQKKKYRTRKRNQNPATQMKAEAAKM